mmetsp:Transcript_2157/g.5726  ORF Transcript_2157/g.5726 Transcript_2157/m.5726 type:complete len:230 (+) Transcript_2157:340-1029(+)
MISTTPSPFASSRAGYLLLAIVFLSDWSCHAYQLPPLLSHAPKTAFLTDQKRRTTTGLSVGADFDSDIEAALGQASISEYERDAEFYRKRNEAYYDGLRKSEDDEIAVAAAAAAAAATTSLEASSEKTDVTDQDHENPSWVTDSISTSSDAARKSFRYIEKTTFSLLTGKPLVALAIFAATGMLVAYLSGFFFLEGYIENWNPVENDMVPYWDDAEIHTIERALPPPNE